MCQLHRSCGPSLAVTAAWGVVLLYSSLRLRFASLMDECLSVLWPTGLLAGQRWKSEYLASQGRSL